MTAASDGHPGSDEDRLPTQHAERRPLGSSLPRAWLVVAATLPLVILVGLGIFLATRGGPTGSQIGAQAPAFTLQDLDGNPVSLADLRGRPVMVNFWASWCVPCVEEFPLLEQAQADHAADGLAIVGIVYRDSAGAARDFMQRMGADWPTLIDPDEMVANAYGIIGPPDTFFIDQGGTVVARQIGQLTATDLQRHLARILVEE